MALLALLAVIVLAPLAPAGGSAAAAAPLPPEFIAVTRYDDPSAEDFERMAEAVATYQSNLYWPAVEQFEPGARDWSRYDAMFEAAAASGIRIRPRIYGSPGWAAARPHHPPDRAHRDEFARFLEATVSRYGPDGAFWAEHPELEPRPPRAWQIWNEPNNPDFWLPRPSASQYLGLLAAAERAIHRADPAAEVIGGELFPTPYREGGVPLAAYLADLYALGGGAHLDGLGVHPYAGSPERAFEIVAEARRIMDRNGDGEKPLWITELGWATGGERATVRVSEEVQAEYLRRAVSLAAARRERLRLAGMTWFSLQDQGGANWPERTGLWREDGSAKPSWEALLEAAPGLGRLGAAPLLRVVHGALDLVADLIDDAVEAVDLIEGGVEEGGDEDEGDQGDRGEDDADDAGDLAEDGEASMRVGLALVDLPLAHGGEDDRRDRHRE